MLTGTSYVKFQVYHFDRGEPVWMVKLLRQESSDHWLLHPTVRMKAGTSYTQCPWSQPLCPAESAAVGLALGMASLGWKSQIRIQLCPLPVTWYIVGTSYLINQYKDMVSTMGLNKPRSKKSKIVSYLGESPESGMPSRDFLAEGWAGPISSWPSESFLQ